VGSVILREDDAIVVAHLYGYPADMIGVASLAAEAGIPVIEDAAQSAGGSLRGAVLGSIGDIAILSFGRGKGTTGGSGGAVLVRTPALAEWTSRARSDLQEGSRGAIAMVSLAAQRLLSHPYLYRLPSSMPGLKLGEMVYRSPQRPRAMSSASAAVLRRTLADESRQLSARRARAVELFSRVRDASYVAAVRPVAGGESGFLRFALIDTRGKLGPCVDLGAVRGYPLTLGEHLQLGPLIRPGETPGKGSKFLRDRLFTVPTHSQVGQYDLARLAEWLEGREVESRALVPVT